MRTAAIAGHSRLLTIGAESKRLTRQSRSRVRRALIGTLRPSLMAKEAGASGRKSKKPVRKILTFRYGKAVLMVPPPRYGKPELQGEVKKPYDSL